MPATSVGTTPALLTSKPTNPARHAELDIELLAP
jgi:hypothetical protein